MLLLQVLKPLMLLCLLLPLLPAPDFMQTMYSYAVYARMLVQGHTLCQTKQLKGASGCVPLAYRTQMDLE